MCRPGESSNQQESPAGIFFMMDPRTPEPPAGLMKRRNKPMNDPVNVALLGYGLAIDGLAQLLAQQPAA